MASFMDKNGRTWVVEINVATIKRVRSLAGVDLLDITGGTVVQRLLFDPILLCDALFAVCKPQADAESVSDEAFGEAMAGDAIENATAALLEELVSFSPSPKDRENLRAVLTKTRAMMDRARELSTEKIESGEIEREAELAIREALANAGGRSTSSPASSE